MARSFWQGEKHEEAQAFPTATVRDRRQPRLGTMNPRTELVMARHRELKSQGLSGLEASRVVLQEAQAGTLGVTQTVKQPVVKQEMLNTCACGNEIKGRGKKCAACYQKAYRERSITK